MFSVRPHIFSSVKKFLRLLQNRVRMQATHIFLKGGDLGWGAPGLGDDLEWGGEATRGAQGCGGGPPPLGLFGGDISLIEPGCTPAASPCCVSAFELSNCSND